MMIDEQQDKFQDFGKLIGRNKNDNSTLITESHKK